MPPEVRQLYDMAASMLADKDKNGVPDMLEGAISGAASTVSHTTQYVVDGKTYTSLEELPPQARQRYEEAMRRFDANSDGVPDALAAVALLQPQPSAPPSPAPPSAAPHVTMVGEGGGMKTAWLVAIGVIVLLAAAVVYLLLTR